MRLRVTATGLRCCFVALIVQLVASPVWAHDPVFGLGPHTLFKGGVEVHTGYSRGEAGVERAQMADVELKYGITGDWTVGVEMPFLTVTEPGRRRSGRGDIRLSSKTRFWRNDRLGVQESAALSLAVIAGGSGSDDVANGGSTDGILGISYGYESRKWYRWAAARYRINGKNDQGLRRGDALLVDLVAGIRLRPYGYREQDWVWMLELNGERIERAELDGSQPGDTGGTRLFVSPGLMWTYRNYAIKTGVQVPVAQNLNGSQEQVDYRFKLEFEGHF